MSEPLSVTRRCQGCEKTKPITEYRTRGGRLNVNCNTCNDYRKKFYQKPGQKRLMQAANLARYGLTPEQWEQKFEEQGRRCASCGKPWQEGERRFHTDHDHATGLFRAILCPNCNTIIGHSQDQVDRLFACIAYLQRAISASSPASPQWDKQS